VHVLAVLAAELLAWDSVLVPIQLGVATAWAQFWNDEQFCAKAPPELRRTTPSAARAEIEDGFIDEPASCAGLAQAQMSFPVLDG